RDGDLRAGLHVTEPEVDRLGRDQDPSEVAGFGQSDLRKKVGNTLTARDRELDGTIVGRELRSRFSLLRDGQSGKGTQARDSNCHAPQERSHLHVSTTLLQLDGS